MNAPTHPNDAERAALAEDIASLRDTLPGALSEASPAALDDRIRRQARLAVDAPARRPFRAWMTPLATAALVVVCVAVVIEQAARGPASIPDAVEFHDQAAPARTDAGVADSSLRARREGAQVQDASKPEDPAAGAAMQPEEARQKEELSRVQVTGSRISRDEHTPLESQAAASSAETGEEEAFLMAPAAPPAAEVLEEKASGDADANASAAELDALAPAAAPLQQLRDNPPSAEEWIRELRRLHDTGQRTNFERQLALFREVYPDVELPPEWQP